VIWTGGAGGAGGAVVVGSVGTVGVSAGAAGGAAATGAEGWEAGGAVARTDQGSWLKAMALPVPADAAAAEAAWPLGRAWSPGREVDGAPVEAGRNDARRVRSTGANESGGALWVRTIGAAWYA